MSYTKLPENVVDKFISDRPWMDGKQMDFLRTETGQYHLSTMYSESDPSRFFPQRGIEFMYRIPPVEVGNLEVPADPKRRRVHIIGTRGCISDLRPESKTVRSILTKRGLVEATCVYNTDSAYFWEIFFGQKLFLDNLLKNTKPALMISTGKIRSYDEHAGETCEVKKLLRHFCGMWRIPLLIVPARF